MWHDQPSVKEARNRKSSGVGGWQGQGRGVRQNLKREGGGVGNMTI